MIPCIIVYICLCYSDTGWTTMQHLFCKINIKYRKI